MPRFTRQTMPTTHEQLLALLPRTGDTAVICNNTRATNIGMSLGGVVFGISLHGHEIIQVEPHTVLVRTCGFATTTTMDRIRRFLPAGYSCTRAGGVPRVFQGSSGTPAASWPLFGVSWQCFGSAPIGWRVAPMPTARLRENPRRSRPASSDDWHEPVLPEPDQFDPERDY